MSEMMKLKVATKRMAGYTGALGLVRFTDGISDEFLPRHIRDRMAASMEFLEVDADGNEQPAGAQHRVIREYKERAPKMEALTRQSVSEKAAEIAKNSVIVAKVPALETRGSLEKIAETKGIKGLREIGVKWGVKHRSIPTLIEMILDAQEKSVAARNKKLEEKSAAEAAKLAETAPAAAVVLEGEKDPNEEAPIPAPTEPAAEAAPEPAPEPVSDKTSAAAAAINAKLKEAAASGDLAAAISQE